ncbi:MFS transporter [Paenibacillus sp. WLX1005]|uniref:MFS transporter n=1 Tax=Paenibacillus sp. WLX1005 TaxID=3243766 RepID=UPI003983FBD0
MTTSSASSAATSRSRLPFAQHRSFYYLIGTQTVSNAADIIYIMGLVSFVLAGTDSIMAGVFVPFFRIASQLLSGLIAPLVLTRFYLPRLLLFCQLGQFLIFSVLAAYLWTAGIQASLTLVFTLIFAMSFLDGWTTPARNSLVPRLVDKDGLLRANGIVSVSDQMIRCAGWAMGGILVAWIGALPTLMLAAVFYAFAMIFTIFIREPHQHTAVHVSSPAPASEEEHIHAKLVEKRHLRTLTEGWKLIWRTRSIRTMIFMDMVDMLGGSVWVGVFMLAFVQQALGQGEEWWGFLNTAYFGGAIGGGLLVVGLVDRLQGREFIAMLSGVAIYSILTIVFALNTIPLLALFIVIAMGPATELAAVSRRTLLQQSVGREQLPKVFSAQDAILNFTFCISLLGMGWVAEQFGIVNLYVLAGLLSICAFGYGLFNRRAFRQYADNINTSNEL